MADEVVIEEYGSFALKYDDGTYAPLPGKLITSQVLDAGVKSAAFSGKTNSLRIVNTSDAGFWYKVGASDVSAAAATDDNRYLAPQSRIEVSIDVNADTHIDTAV